MDKKIVIVDYGSGNLYSITQACKHFGFDPKLSFNADEILNADKVLLPGVGAFEGAMRQLQNMNLVSVLKDYVSKGKPLMGVCLGMQLLFEKSYEFGEHEGLGLVEGEIKRFPSSYMNTKMRIPHIGWNKVFNKNSQWFDTPFKEFPDGGMMYFVHSYYAQPSNSNDILSTTLYNDFEFCSSVRKENVYGFQFHPEKSGEEGLTVYKNFLSIE
jgi:glutamine amidotransferase